MDKLLLNLKGISNRKAQFKSVIAYCNGISTFVFEGIVTGKITLDRLGDKGFGYDPIFMPNGFNKTFAQITMEEKNAISHRGIAITKFLDFIAKS